VSETGRWGPIARRGALVAAAAAAVIGLGGGGSSKGALPGDRIPGRTLTIYSSVPFHGASRVSAQAVVGGEALALSQVHYRLGRFRLVFKALDDSTLQRGEWDPGQTTLNARIAIRDPTTIGYIGDFNSGASAISIPVLNRFGIPQISPASTAVGLTSGGPGAAPGEPDKYYPTGTRTYARVVPSDAVQAVAQVRLQESAGCTKTFVLNDGEVDGFDTAASFTVAAEHSNIRVVAMQPFDPKATDYRPLASAIGQSGADCVLISAITGTSAVLLVEQVAAALPGVKLFGSAGMAESTFANAAQGGIPPALDPRVTITVPTLDAAAYPAAARAFYNAYAQEYGVPQPYAIYGYEAMSLLLSAMDRATEHGTAPPRRSNVVKALFATRNRRSVLGTYSIEQDGDTSIRRYGAYRVLSGQLAFWKAIDA
jgi:branched-chain amino acid transport system substrate-binding protein